MTDSVNGSVRDLARDYIGLAFLVAALAGGAVAWAPSAYAQVNPFRGYKGPTLTKEDLDASTAAAQKLLESDPASIGQKETWVGPKTGNQGTLTIRKVFQHAGMPCRTFASQVVYRQTHGKRELTLTACRTAGGEWKLVN